MGTLNSPKRLGGTNLPPKSGNDINRGVASTETFEALYRTLDAVSAKKRTVGTIWQLGGERRRISWAGP
jgi:hypothetical protein